MKILVFYLGLSNPHGGTEGVIMNLYHHVRNNEIKFDFLVYQKGILDKEIIKNGDHVYYIDRNKEFHKQLKQFFDAHKGEYDIVHAHMNKDVGTILKYAYRVGGGKAQNSTFAQCKAERI